MMLSIFAAAAGAAAVRMVIGNYYERKRARVEIVMVRDGKGRLVDRAKIFERRMFYGYLAAITIIAVAGYLALTNYRPDPPFVRISDSTAM